jgi:hypothetical protein
MSALLNFDRKRYTKGINVLQIWYIKEDKNKTLYTKLLPLVAVVQLI